MITKISKPAFVLCVLALSVLPGCRKDRPSYDAARERLREYVLDRAPKGIQPLDIDFDGRLRLIGYTRSPAGRARTGRPAELVLYWRADKPIEPGYRIYTHLLDAAGERIASFDDAGPLREKADDVPALPPDAWEVGKIYVDKVPFAVPRGVKTPTVRLVAGVMKGDERLRVLKGEKDSAGNALITTLSVAQKRKPRRTSRVPNANPVKLAATVKLQIDGKLDEPAWQSAEWMPLVDVSTGKRNRTFPVNARVKLLWSDEGFYVGFDVSDPDVVGGFERGAREPHLWTRDTVEIMIDPDGDGDNEDYYEIQIGPQNLVFDSQFDRYNQPKQEPDGPFGHEEWSSQVSSAVVVNGTLDNHADKDTGYVVEALFPWKAFTKARRSPPAPGDMWRMNFYAMQENSGVAWSAILNEGNFHKASRFGRVTWTADTVPAAALPSAKP